MTCYHIQCNAIITQSIFSTFFTRNTPQLTHMGEIWGVCCEFKVWFMFCHCHCNGICVILKKLTGAMTALNCIALTHWGWVMHICVGNLTIIGSNNGLSPGRCQAIIWTNAGIVLIGTLGTNFNEIFIIKIHTFSFKKIHLKMLSGKWQPSCLGLNVLSVRNGPDHELTIDSSSMTLLQQWFS